MPPAFAQLTVDIQRRLCDQLSVPFHVAIADVKPCETAGKPEICQDIESDGNCFYRAISFAVSNTESNHMEIRKLVCNFTVQEKAMMQSALRPQFDSGGIVHQNFMHGARWYMGNGIRDPLFCLSITH